MTPAETMVRQARVPEAVPERTVGLWEVRRITVPTDDAELAWRYYKQGLQPGDRYTALLRTTIATMHRGSGEPVMEDSPVELRRHLPVLLQARGDVLVSGLGLGCVVRGLLARDEVRHVDVVEIDTSVIELVGGEFEDDPRVTIHLGDALTVRWPDEKRWDYAWHDIWSEDDPLDLLHVELLRRYRDRCPRQGAWGLKRWIKRFWPGELIG